MKKVSAMFLLVALCSMMLVACGGKETGIVGTWEVIEEGKTAMSLTFTEDGKYTMVMESLSMEGKGTYKLDGEKLSMTGTAKVGEVEAEETTLESTVKVDGDKLTQTDSTGKSIEYTKKK